MVKNKKCHSKKMAALVTAVVLAVSAAVSFAVPQVKAANGPCDTGDWAYAYINVRNGEESNLLFSSEGTNSIDGMSYDRESNTLTLNNYKSSTTVIVTNMMGDDFKINLVGDNEIGSIGSYGDAWGGSINISGNGSLVINADKSDDYGIAFFAEGTNSVLSVADTCNVTIYSGSKAVVYTSDNLTNKPIKDNGTLKENVTYNVSHPLEISRLCARYYEYDPYTTNIVYKNETDNTSLYYIKELTYIEPAKVTYTLYKLTTKKAMGDVYYADKVGEYDNIPAGYTKTTLDNPISYYESDSGSGGTSQVIINTATNEKYVSAYVYENKTSYYRICKLLEKLGVDERSNDELWLIDYDNPVATYNPVVGSDNLPDGYKYDGTEIEGLYNVECVADKLTFTAKSSSDNTTDNSKGDTTNNPSDNTTDEKPSTPESSTTNTVVDVSDGSTTIKADEIRKIIEDNKVNDVVIKSNNDVTFTFAKGTMLEVSQVAIYDFSTAITSDIKEAGDMPADVTEDIFVSKIVYNYSGVLPATASIKLNVGKAYEGQTLYYSQLLDDGTIISMMSAVVDNDGYMTVEQDHCSTYLITKQQITSSSSDISLPGTSVENVTEAAGNTVETPQTGDMTHIYWAGYLLVLSLMGIGFTILMAGKLKKEQ
ncbi:Uncharacterised protein [Lachnospira pectinoschiza]|uniref:hypothetical protein n=1 Tax=Lachnospira pectinoschiza TaxID=28052 RepID=UPI0006C18A29|nr:Uncharacterised protein [Lachnospira pectinoschiza]